MSQWWRFIIQRRSFLKVMFWGIKDVPPFNLANPELVQACRKKPKTNIFQQKQVFSSPNIYYIASIIEKQRWTEQNIAKMWQKQVWFTTRVCNNQGGKYDFFSLHWCYVESLTITFPAYWLVLNQSICDTLWSLVKCKEFFWCFDLKCLIPLIYFKVWDNIISVMC